MTRSKKSFGLFSKTVPKIVIKQFWVLSHQRTKVLGQIHVPCICTYCINLHAHICTDICLTHLAASPPMYAYIIHRTQCCVQTTAMCGETRNNNSLASEVWYKACRVRDSTLRTGDICKEQCLSEMCHHAHNTDCRTIAPCNVSTVYVVFYIVEFYNPPQR